MSTLFIYCWLFFDNTLCYVLSEYYNKQIQDFPVLNSVFLGVLFHMEASLDILTL